MKVRHGLKHITGSIKDSERVTFSNTEN